MDSRVLRAVSPALRVAVHPGDRAAADDDDDDCGADDDASFSGYSFFRIHAFADPRIRFPEMGVGRARPPDTVRSIDSTRVARVSNRYQSFDARKSGSVLVHLLVES
jgi:hypothetical protein